MKKRREVMKKVMKLIGRTIEEIAVHSIEIIQGIEIKITKEEIVQDSIETEAIQDTGKEEAKTDIEESQVNTRPNIITEKIRSIITIEASTIEARVEKGQQVETE